MATINIGRVRPIFKGAWSSSTSYTAMDVVTIDGASYVALVDNSNVPVVVNTSHWQLVADKGADSTVQGPQGPTGPQGPQGPQGTEGPTSGSTRYIQILAVPHDVVVEDDTDIIGSIELPFAGNFVSVRATTQGASFNVKVFKNGTTTIAHMGATLSGNEADTTTSFVKNDKITIEAYGTSSLCLGLVLTLTVEET